jgi:hypothetical protein
MVRDSITRTGARGSGVERRRPFAWRFSRARRAPAQNGECHAGSGEHEGRRQTGGRDSYAPSRKVPSEKPALKPQRGKLAVRNYRGGDGNVGTIRKPLRAIALPDMALTLASTAIGVEDYLTWYH